MPLDAANTARPVNITGWPLNDFGWPILSRTLRKGGVIAPRIPSPANPSTNPRTHPVNHGDFSTNRRTHAMGYPNLSLHPRTKGQRPALYQPGATPQAGI